MSIKFFEINENDLAGAWRENRKALHQLVFEAAALRKAYAEAKARAKVVEAEAWLRFKSDPEGLGLGAKPTQKDIESAVVVDKAVQRAERDAINAKHDLDIAEGAISTLEDRRRNIEFNLETHWLLRKADGTPRVSEDAKQSFEEEAANAVGRRVVAKLNKR